MMHSSSKYHFWRCQTLGTKNLADIRALHEIIIQEKSTCRLRKSTAEGADIFCQAVRDHSECFLCIYYPLTHMVELMQHRGSCWRSQNASVKEEEWRSVSVRHFISLRGGSWPGWKLLIYLLTHSLLSLVHISMAMYQTVSKQFPCLFFFCQTFPF